MKSSCSLTSCAVVLRGSGKGRVKFSSAFGCFLVSASTIPSLIGRAHVIFWSVASLLYSNLSIVSVQTNNSVTVPESNSLMESRLLAGHSLSLPGTASHEERSEGGSDAGEISSRGLKKVKSERGRRRGRERESQPYLTAFFFVVSLCCTKPF